MSARGTSSGNRGFTVLELKFDMDKYTINMELRPGSQAQVFVVKDADGAIFVLKQVGLEEGSKFGKNAIREPYFLQELKHQHIVRMHEMFVHEGSTFMVLEYVPDDLSYYMATHDPLTPDVIKKYLNQILLATSHCHSLGVLHRDLKPANILVDASKGIVKVADFGLARGLITPDQDLSPQVVTLDYRAPEIIMGSEHYTGAADIWSVGCIFAEMISGKELFEGNTEMEILNDIFRKLGYPREGNSLSALVASFLPDEIPEPQGLGAAFELLDPAAMDLIMNILALDPEKRLTAKKALEHVYFS